MAETVDLLVIGGGRICTRSAGRPIFSSSPRIRSTRNEVSARLTPSTTQRLR